MSEWNVDSARTLVVSEYRRVSQHRRVSQYRKLSRGLVFHVSFDRDKARNVHMGGERLLIAFAVRSIGAFSSIQ